MALCELCGEAVRRRIPWPPGFNPVDRSYTLPDDRVRLVTETTWRTLELLVSHMGRYVSRERVWAYLYEDELDAPASEKLVDVWVCKVRRMLEGGDYYIGTRHLMGWRLASIAETSAATLQFEGKRRRRFASAAANYRPLATVSLALHEEGRRVTLHREASDD